MKKLLSTICLTFGAVLLFAQTQINVPQAVHQAFKDGHPMHDFITWEMEGQNYKGSSIDMQQMHHINVYTPAGKLIRTETELSSMGIPITIKNYVLEKYPNEKNNPVWMVVDSNGDRSYYTTLNNEKVSFDKEGRVTKN